MYNPFSLEGKSILITGASSGIGKATAIECSKLGATVTIVGRNEERLRQTLEEMDISLSQSHSIVIADLTTEDGIAAVVDTKKNFDGVFSNAGTGFNKPIKFLKESDLEDLFHINTFSHAMLAKTLFKKKMLNKGSSYVLTASIGGCFSYGPGNTLYGMTKAAVNSFMKYAAIEFASRKVRVNSICPGMIDTPLIHGIGNFSEEDLQKDAESYLLKRYGKPQEVAHAVAFLLSDASSFVDGASLIIDGGFTANH
jgi:NAD(P)-dependent dehydrogenase (short-subunit alcohol dehydrogenase family)